MNHNCQTNLIKTKNIKITNISSIKKLEINFTSTKFTSQHIQTYKQDEINEIKKNEETQTKSKKQIWSVLFLLINVVVVLAIFINQAVQGEVKSLTELFAEKPYYRFLFLSLGAFMLSTLVEGLKFSLLLKKSTKEFKPLVSYKVGVIGRYWDCITPLGSGGQPFQIFYLNKNKISGDISTGIPLAKYMSWQVVFVVIGIFVLLSPINVYLNTAGSFVTVAAWLGLVLNFILFVFTMIISTNKYIGNKLIVGGLKLLCKLRIVKNYDKQLSKVNAFVANYQSCMKQFSGSFWTVLFQVLLAAINILINISIAYFIYLAFNYPNIEYSWIQIMCLSMTCELACCFIPLPGGSGAAEVSFVAMFSELFRSGTVFWALLFWRFFTYYAHIILGFILTILDFISGKNKRLVNPNKIKIIEEK